MPIDYDVLLWPVFQELRRLGAELSLAEYLQAIQMLRSGVGLDDASTLAQACRLLWAKSREEQELFDAAFAQKAAPMLTLLTTPFEPLDEDTSPDQETTPFTDDESAFPTSSAEILGLHLSVEPVAPLHAPFVAAEPSSTPTSPPISPYPQKIYHFATRLPFSKSEMSAHWRQLRRMQRTKSTTELDVEATIYDICQHGLLRKPFMRPHAGNTAQLLLFIDQEGSMTPFKLLIDALVESVTHNSLAGKTSLYYFHDCPNHTLYEDPLLGQPIPLEQALARYNHDTHILIVSDAGAARAHYDDDRVRKTRRFLEILHRYSYLYAWINPVPFARWQSTTAADIEQMVPMFPLDRDGLDDAIQILRGHPFPPGVNLYA